jgi:FkbM family methyltransferase
MINLSEICNNIKFTPKHVIEVGVAEPWNSHVKEFFFSCPKIQMFEPNPKYYKMLVEWYSGLSNLTIHNLAVANTNDKIGFYTDATSIKDVPYNTADKMVPNYSRSQDNLIEVQACTIDNFDDNNIDIIAIDTEGSEWFTLKHMISRPKIVCVETHGTNYINPFITEILNWMKENNYQKYSQDNSDTVFIKI